MEQNKPKRKVLGSEALGELLGRMKDGTFKDIINDWKWIAAYTRRYRAAVIIYTLLGILSASFALVSLMTMVAHAAQAINHVWPWWAFGVGMGIAILVLFGVFEKKREEMLRLIARLREWEQ